MSLSKRTVERPTRMAVMLENLPEEQKVMVPVSGKGTVPIRFEMGTWLHCGTAACAVGYASLHPEFRKWGLKLRWDKQWGDWCPYDVGKHSIESVFELTTRAIDFLFLPMSYERGNRADVYQRIRAFIKSGGVIPNSANI